MKQLLPDIGQQMAQGRASCKRPSEVSPTCTLALCLGAQGAAQTAAPGAGAQTEEMLAGDRDQTLGLPGPRDSTGCKTSEDVPGQRRPDPAGLAGSRRQRCRRPRADLGESGSPR